MEPKTENINVDVLRQVVDQSQGEKRIACLIVISGPDIGKLLTLDKSEYVVGREQTNDIPIPNQAISRQHARIFRVSERSYAIQDLGSTNGTFCNGNRIQEKILDDGDKIMIGTTSILKFSYQDNLEKEFQEHIFDSVVRDSLTGCFNKKYFEENIKSEFSYAVRHKTRLSLIMMDLDHFKNVNDTHGHMAGDQVLRELGEAVAKLIRNEDIFVRYGGEEFAIVARGTDEKQAFQFAERVRKTVAKHIFKFNEVVIPLTISIGIASLDSGTYNTVDELISAADQLLYKSKENGRNRVESINFSSGTM